MTLLASVASIFCSVSACAAAPAVAVVPAESVTRVEIISPSFDNDAAIDSESLSANEEAQALASADPGDEAGDFTPDKEALASNSDELVPADVIADDELLLPADVVVDDEGLLPADVLADIDAELLPADVLADIDAELLPADVIADIDADADAVSEAEADGVALAEANANTAPLFDEDPAEDSTPPPAEEPGVKNDSPEAPGDGEAAS